MAGFQDQDTQATQEDPSTSVPPCVVSIGFHKANGNLGTVYTRVTEILESSGWTVRSSPIGRYHLLLGSAQGKGIPFRAVGATADMYGFEPLVNFHRGFRSMCRKAAMVRTLRDYAADTGMDLGTFLPASFLFYPAKPELSERQQFLDYCQTRGQERPLSWILKPSDGAKGERIVCVKGAAEALQHLDAQAPGSVAWVCQQYLDRPMLLPGGRKFDMRVWVLVGCDYRVHLYRHGVFRTCSVPFSMDDMTDTAAHLSNHCIQERHPGFGDWEAGNELFYPQFQALLPDGVSLEEHILPQMECIICHVFRAGRDMLQVPENAGYRSFGLYGLDFMLSDTHQAFLIEVNSSPAAAAALLAPITNSLVAFLLQDKAISTGAAAHTRPPDGADLGAWKHLPL